jgi:hypothetical protein
MTEIKGRFETSTQGFRRSHKIITSFKMGKLYRAENGAYVLPGVLSALIPGLGQLIKKQTGKALMFFGIWLGWGLVVWVLHLIPFFGGLAGWLTGAFLWLVNVLDALLAEENR